MKEDGKRIGRGLATHAAIRRIVSPIPAQVLHKRRIAHQHDRGHLAGNRRRVSRRWREVGGRPPAEEVGRDLGALRVAHKHDLRVRAAGLVGGDEACEVADAFGLGLGVGF